MFILENSKDTFDISFQMDDGTEKTLHIKAPTLAIVKRMQHMGDAEDVYTEIGDVLHEILKRNTDGAEITRDDIDNFDIDQIAAILSEFRAWMARERTRKN